MRGVCRALQAGAIAASVCAATVAIGNAAQSPTAKPAAASTRHPSTRHPGTRHHGTPHHGTPHQRTRHQGTSTQHSAPSTQHPDRRTSTPPSAATASAATATGKRRPAAVAGVVRRDARRAERRGRGEDDSQAAGGLHAAAARAASGSRDLRGAHHDARNADRRGCRGEAESRRAHVPAAQSSRVRARGPRSARASTSTPATGCRSTPRARTSTTSPTRRRCRRRCSRRTSTRRARSAGWRSAIAMRRRSRPDLHQPPATSRSTRGITSTARRTARAAAWSSTTCSRPTPSTCSRCDSSSGSNARFEDIDISIDGERVALIEYETGPAGGADGRGAVPIRTEPISSAGQHHVAAAFVRKVDGPYEDLIRPHDWSFAGGGSGGPGITTLPHVRDLIIKGPYRITGISETPSRQKIFSCRPTSPAEERPCARQIVARIGGEAYRRPLTAGEIDRLMPFFEERPRSGACAPKPAERRAEAGFEGGVRTALEAILASPHFIFRLEKEPETATPAAPTASPTSISRRGCRSSSGARRRIRNC